MSAIDWIALPGILGGACGLLAGIFVLVVIGWLVISSGKTEKEMKKHIANARPGEAKITRVGESESTKYHGILVSLYFQVYPEYGPDYAASSEWEVEPAHVPDIQEGKSIRVKVDPQAPNLVFPDVPWATRTGDAEEDINAQR